MVDAAPRGLARLKQYAPTQRRTRPRGTGTGKHWIGLAVLTLLVVLAPLLGSEYYITVLTIAGVWALSAVGMTVLLGGSGELNLAYGSFYGIGAYTTALLLTHHVNLGLALLTALALAAVLTLVIGIPLLRTRGLFYAIVTLSFAVLASDIFVEWTSVTKGSVGLPVPQTALGWLPTYGSNVGAVTAQIYLLVWLCTIVVTAIAIRVLGSPYGMVLRGIGGDERLVEGLGYRPGRYRLSAFVFTGAAGGLAGGLYALYIGYVTPDPFTFWTSFAIVIMVVVGGRESVWGSLIAAVGLTVLPELLRAAEAYRMIAYAGVLYLVIVVSRNRIVGGLSH